MTSEELLSRAEPLLERALPAHVTMTERREKVLLHVQGRRDRLHAVATLDDVEALESFAPTNWRWIIVDSATLARRAAELDLAAARAGAGVLVLDAAGLARARSAPPVPGIFDRRHEGLTAAWSKLSDW